MTNDHSFPPRMVLRAPRSGMGVGAIAPTLLSWGDVQHSTAATWRKATAQYLGRGLPVRWQGSDGAWRYPTGLQADNLLAFHLARCEVEA